MSTIAKARLISIVVGVAVGILLAIILMIALHDNKKLKSDYDERQELIRGKGFKYSFYFILIYMGLFILIDMTGVVLPISNALISFSGIIISLGIYATYAIMKDGYLGLNEQKNKTTILFIAIGIINLVIGAINTIGHLELGDYDPLNDISHGLLNFICAIGIIYIAVLMLIKSGRSGGDEDEEPED